MKKEDCFEVSLLFLKYFIVQNVPPEHICQYVRKRFKTKKHQTEYPTIDTIISNDIPRLNTQETTSHILGEDTQSDEEGSLRRPLTYKDCP